MTSCVEAREYSFQLQGPQEKLEAVMGERERAAGTILIVLLGFPRLFSLAAPSFLTGTLRVLSKI
jgi:hypothetical protein